MIAIPNVGYVFNVPESNGTLKTCPTIELQAFGERLLRGYGQMFLANGVLPGALVLAGLFVLSPTYAGWSLLAAGLVTALATWLERASAELDAGLFGVNGALLGFSWIALPELAAPIKAASSTAGGASSSSNSFPSLISPSIAAHLCPRGLASSDSKILSKRATWPCVSSRWSLKAWASAGEFAALAIPGSALTSCVSAL